jgi:hypothetical protein
MSYPDAAWERAMTVQEVLMKALSGELHWFRAADILGWSPRTLRRWRVRYLVQGFSGLLDRRRGRPSPRRVPLVQLEAVLRLYRDRAGRSSITAPVSVARHVAVAHCRGGLHVGR